MKLFLKLILTVLAGLILAVAISYYIIIYLLLSRIELFSTGTIVLASLVFAVIPSATIVCFLLYRLVIKPISSFREVTNTIARGILGRKITINSFDELDELAHNFNSVIFNLTSGLQNLANSLKAEKVKEAQLAANYEELNKEKSKADALLASMGDGVIAIDTDLKIILFNTSASVLTGFEVSEVTGKPYFHFLNFLKEKENTPAEDFIKKAITGDNASQTGRIVLVRKDGNKIPISPITSYILDNQKNIIGVVVALRDMTHERQLEKLKDDFVSVASHELRTPMTAIKGLISMIQEGDYGEVNQPLKEPMTDIFSSTERLIQLINDMLDVSRMEAGRTKFTLSDVFIKDLINEVTSEVKPLANQKNIELIIKNTSQDKVRTDPDKIKQVLFNLIGNALKFTETGSIKITTKTLDNFVYTSISDTGMGIAPEDQQKLFSKFSQVNSLAFGRPPGTGLGLYITKEFVKMLGGDIWIEHSEVGKGSTFTFSLPLSNTEIAQRITIKLANYT